MTEKKIEKAWKEYHTIPKEYGCKSVKEFNRTYKNLRETLETAEHVYSTAKLQLART